ncbi:MAG: amidohydrolase family protein [Clostridia bacterium]|nr:amidohydrolase family protein [Clostridia bacterium]
MKIINSHAHIYPNKIAKKATDAIGAFYGIKMDIEEGTTERLIRIEKAAGVDKIVVHSCATKPEQVRSINLFIKSEMDAHKEFIGFMTLHQDLSAEEIESEIEFGINNGFLGIKLHPDFQKFDIDGEKAHKIYNALNNAKKKLPILFHTGDNRYEYSKPYRLANVAKEYKGLNFIGAHFGGYRCWDELDCYTGLNNVFFDTSSSLAFISKEKAVSLIKKFGVEKFFFGDDFPMWDVKEEIKRFDALSLTEREKELILSKNIEDFLKL